MTPDSFSDGGLFNKPKAALQKIDQLIEDGADIVDIGAESSRPGATFISESEEWSRLEPVLQEISSRDYQVSFSIDTNKPTIMKRLPDFGVSIVNDIKGTADAETLKQLSKAGCHYIAMHMHGTPMDMQQKAIQKHGISIIENFYNQTSKTLQSAGFPKDKIWLDPGIGFGKSDATNLQLISQTINKSSNYNILIGISRKSFIGRLCDLADEQERDPASKMLEACLMMSGVKCIRTHQVKQLKNIRDLLCSNTNEVHDTSISS